MVLEKRRSTVITANFANKNLSRLSDIRNLLEVRTKIQQYIAAAGVEPATMPSMQRQNAADWK
jgi:hypothetical protein